MWFVTYYNSSELQFDQGSEQIVLVGHSFGGLVIKSLMYEVHKAVTERARSTTEKTKQARCKGFQEKVKGIMFYAVPHEGANKNFKTYLTDCNNIAFLQNSKRLTGLMRSVDKFNRQMVKLSTDFDYSVPQDFNLFAIVEGPEVWLFHDYLHSSYYLGFYECWLKSKSFLLFQNLKIKIYQFHI